MIYLLPMALSECKLVFIYFINYNIMNGDFGQVKLNLGCAQESI